MHLSFFFIEESPRTPTCTATDTQTKNNGGRYGQVIILSITQATYLHRPSVPSTLPWWLTDKWIKSCHTEKNNCQGTGTIWYLETDNSYIEILELCEFMHMSFYEDCSRLTRGGSKSKCIWDILIYKKRKGFSIYLHIHSITVSRPYAVACWSSSSINSLQAKYLHPVTHAWFLIMRFQQISQIVALALKNII